MGGELFRKVAAVARLRKSQFRRPDKTPRTYDRRIFTLDGKIELDISFGEVTMKTPGGCSRSALTWGGHL